LNNACLASGNHAIEAISVDDNSRLGVSLLGDDSFFQSVHGERSAQTLLDGQLLSSQTGSPAYRGLGHPSLPQYRTHTTHSQQSRSESLPRERINGLATSWDTRLGLSSAVRSNSLEETLNKRFHCRLLAW